MKLRHQQKKEENHKNTFILIETLSLIFQDSIKMKEKPRFR